MILLSIIVPVYNVEKFIIDCLGSLISQIDFFVSELIIINDGSEDNSLNLIYDFFDKYSEGPICNVKVISQINTGLSSARNIGIKAAKGKYLSFIDSDDVVLDGFYRQIYNVISRFDVDIVKFKFKTFEDSRVMLNSDSYLNLSGNYNLNYDLFVDLLNDSSWYAWAHVYRSSLFENIKFPEDLNFEDVATIPYIYNLSKSIYFIDSYLYGYRQREGSILSSVKPNIVNKNIRSLNFILSRFLLDSKRDERFYILYIFFMRVYLTYIMKHKGMFCSYKEWKIFEKRSRSFRPSSSNLFRSKRNYVYYILYCKTGFFANYIIILLAKLYGFYKRYYL